MGEAAGIAAELDLVEQLWTANAPLPPNGATDSRGNSWASRVLAPRRVAPEAW